MLKSELLKLLSNEDSRNIAFGQEIHDYEIFLDRVNHNKLSVLLDRLRDDKHITLEELDFIFDCVVCLYLDAFLKWLDDTDCIKVLI